MVMAIPPFPFEDSTGIFPHSFSNLTVSQDFGERGCRSGRAGPTVIGRWLLFGTSAQGPSRWGRGPGTAGGTYPEGGCLNRKHPLDLGKPGAPACPAGVPISPEKWGERGRGKPLDPDFYSRSFPLAGFCGGYLCNDRGAISSDILRPIWDAFSRKKYAGKHFCERKFPNQGTHMGLVIAPRPQQCDTTAKTSEWERAGHKKGGAGLPPRLVASGLSLEKAWIPPGTGRKPTPQVLTCDGPNGTTCQRQKPASPAQLGVAPLLPG